ncbi:AAA family ATPase [Sinorhizobium glycinis]|nr:AAA family ATPase [Sinorhizobium glycinis]
MEFTSVLMQLRRAALENRNAFLHSGLALHSRAGMAALLKSSRNFIAYCGFVRFVRMHRLVFAKPAFVIVIDVPKVWRVPDVQAAASMAFGHNNELRFLNHAAARDRKGRWEIDTSDYLAAPKLVIFTAEETEIHPDFEIAATFRAKIDLGLERHFRALSSLLKCEDLTDEAIAMISKEPSERIDAVFRLGHSAEVAISKLKSFAAPEKILSEVVPQSTTTGFGPAGEWAQNLKKDIAAWRQGTLPWSEVDRGVLIYGPPGTGKTRFARVLAQECGMHLVATSLSRWQSSKDGALGDLLRAMYASFAEAKADAPSLLFIDEIDSVGDRNRFPARHRNYSTQVVNGLLEALDGVDGREGVIVMGACNRPDQIDPAVLRSGRLERHIYFPLPDIKARGDILSFYLPSLVDEPQLRNLAARLVGYSGADIENLARQARRRARENNRAVTLTDVEEYMPERQALDDQALLRVAIHEAGHALLAHHLTVGTVQLVEIYDHRDIHPTQTTGNGMALVETPKRTFRTRSSILNHIAMTLGGLAAEEIAYEDRSTSSGGTKESDLALATAMAIEMVSEYGLGNSLVFAPKAVDPGDALALWQDPFLRKEIDAVLNREFQRAKDLLSARKAELMEFATTLQRKKRLEGRELEGLLSGNGPAD